MRLEVGQTIILQTNELGESVTEHSLLDIARSFEIQCGLSQANFNVIEDLGTSILKT